MSSKASYSPVNDEGSGVVSDKVPASTPVEYTSNNPPEVQERDDFPEVLPSQFNQQGVSHRNDEAFSSAHKSDPTLPYNQGDWANQRSQKWRKRTCGLPPWGLCLLLIATTIIIILAAVLGGVLGTRHTNSSSPAPGSSGGSSNSSSNSSSDQPGTAQTGTGIGVTFLAGQGNNPITYLQDRTNNIIENIWTPSNDSTNSFVNSTKSTVATDAKKGSPIVAMSYLSGATNLLTRHVVYIDNNNQLKDAISDTKSNGQWSNGALGATQTQALGVSNVALTACWAEFYNDGEGIRLYYGSIDNTLQEMGASTGNSTWNWQYWNQWFDVAAPSGVACATHDPFINIYYVNSTSGRVQQSWFDYSSTGTAFTWEIGPAYNQLDTDLASGTAIAASNDGQNTELISFQLQDGSIQEVTASVNNNTTQYESYMNIASNTMQSSKLGSMFLGDGTVFMYQDSNANIITSGWSEGMQATFNATLPFSA
ncbi:MAG: hypothetical protein Q9165_000149 [Trypethelium subeluteriae]